MDEQAQVLKNDLKDKSEDLHPSTAHLKHPVTIILYGALAGDVEPRQLRL